LTISVLSKPWIPRVFPFALYILFIPLESAFEFILANNTAALYLTPFFYTVRILLVIIALIYFRNAYDELKWEGINRQGLILSLFIGAMVFILWINLDQDFAKQGENKSFDPNLLPDVFYYIFIIIRLTGASLIVPLFEELFWRSFILRYIINPDFTSIRIGAFTWPSFIIASVLFGLEHNLWLAGIVAGVLYNMLLYRTKNLYLCIMAHGMTNLLLGIYVIKTGLWAFW